MSSSRRRPDLALLLVLLLVDFGFVVLHGLVGLHLISDRAFTLTRDRGYAELFQYGKELTLTVLLAYLGRRERSPLFAVWAVLFGYVLLDDSLTIHERLGAAIATGRGWPPLFGLRSVDLGELVVLGVAGGILLLAMATAYRRAAPEPRSFSRVLLLCLGALAFFAVVVDLLHQWAFEIRWLRIGLDVVEEAGEHVVMSLAVWLTVMAVTRGPRRSVPDSSTEAPPSPP